MAPFVYQQKNRAARAGAEVCEIWCKRAACNIQHCLARLVPNHQGQIDQAQCAFVIDKYAKCCDAAVARFGEGEEGARLARIAKGEKA